MSGAMGRRLEEIFFKLTGEQEMGALIAALRM
jgi:hypothetical protein